MFRITQNWSADGTIETELSDVIIVDCAEVFATSLSERLHRLQGLDRQSFGGLDALEIAAM